MVSLRLTQLGSRLSVIAGAAALVSAVACSDSPTAPRPATASIPTSGAQPMILPLKSTVTVHVRTIWGTLLPETAAIKFFVGADSGVIWDNSANDQDPTVGSIKVSLLWSSSYKACLVYDTKNYAIDVTKPYCNSAAGGTSAVDLGSLVMRQFPIAGFYMQDISGNNITGGKITLTAPPSDGYTATATDGGANDLSLALDGKIVFKANRPGTYTWCEIAPPTGYSLTSPNCGTIDLYWDLGTATILHHAKSRMAL